MKGALGDKTSHHLMFASGMRRLLSQNWVSKRLEKNQQIQFFGTLVMIACTLTTLDD